MRYWLVAGNGLVSGGSHISSSLPKLQELPRIMRDLREFLRTRARGGPFQELGDDWENAETHDLGSGIPLRRQL